MSLLRYVTFWESMISQPPKSAPCSVTLRDPPATLPANWLLGTNEFAEPISAVFSRAPAPWRPPPPSSETCWAPSKPIAPVSVADSPAATVNVHLDVRPLPPVIVWAPYVPPLTITLSPSSQVSLAASKDPHAAAS